VANGIDQVPRGIADRLVLLTIWPVRDLPPNPIKIVSVLS